MTEKKNENKSLFFYTSLIFVAAILLIILAFFGQANLQKSQPKAEEPVETAQVSAPPEGGITERVAQLSEDNRVLLEEKVKLEETLQKKEEEIENLKNSKMSLENKISDYDLLLSANGYLNVGNDAKASEILGKIDVSKLSADGQILYNNIKNTLQ